ncbi:protein pellino-like [Sitophilus oryzae]|uniref:Protein pellino-like n=1 Tax=Sitophilus oryzae TaxID=7048 RepID=A0A6J2Y856_SITOR|nr:protein pellino-like [Sitophilus oryzae]
MFPKAGFATVKGDDAFDEEDNIPLNVPTENPSLEMQGIIQEFTNNKDRQDSTQAEEEEDEGQDILCLSINNMSEVCEKLRDIQNILVIQNKDELAVVIAHTLMKFESSYNGFLPQGDRGRRRSKFVLYKRPAATGVKKSRHYVVKTPHSSQAILDTMQHSISYTLSRNHAVIVEYTNDEETDMFQIGRSSESPIDFVVMDTIPGDKNGEVKVNQSTISRFACRILCGERNNPKWAFDYHCLYLNYCIVCTGLRQSNFFFLRTGVDMCVQFLFMVQEKACKWQENGREIDGQTTNGVLIMHPSGGFCGGEAKCGVWLETSVGGGIFTKRESRSAQQRGQMVEDVTNVLQDGTLIDLCGATLLWRSAEGLEKTPSKHDLEKVIDEINAGRPQCPVGLNTLVIPRRVSPNENQQQPYVYLNCGHVQGLHDWGQDKDSGARKCPICLEQGPVVKVCMGLEPAFYVDSGLPTFAFNPCGHMATEKTVKYWANVVIPHGTNGFQSVCPFCACPLSGSPGYIRLIFQDNVD